MSTLAPKGLSWVTVRQFRRTLWTAAALVLLALAGTVALRVWEARTPGRRAVHGDLLDDGLAYDLLRLTMESGAMYLLLLVLVTGAFVAGPLVAREFETGTYRLSLTQSLTPAAWLRAKVLTAGAVSTVLTLALMGVFHIGWSRVSGTYNLAWGDRGPYESGGVVLLAYVIASVGIGTLIGLLVRRTLLAMAATGLVMGVVLLVLGAVRWSFLPVLTVTGPTGSALVPPADILQTDMGLTTRSGGRMAEWACSGQAADAVPEDSGTMSDAAWNNAWNKAYDSCLTEHGVTGQYLDYHPYSHYWPTQLIESGILLALAGLALFAAFRVLRARLP
ncbi:ABC transporter permease [Streptomyces roseicoloratus]|uniref:ABC transporter permease n=1 Tax=Streptomyces roseicoloratus TaxID=2508722 RepID=A0ABY9S383_9ACTN|nr:ABC transporter permease [Streptomyces roseicoloratus]WMX48888.1 ABC transporter permease [Streptomyces roseicoloratus]